MVMISICAASRNHSGVATKSKKRIDQRALSIDISDQQFRLFPKEVLDMRDTLEHLIADGNSFTDSAMNIPSFPKLKTLTLNDNKIRNIAVLLQNLSRSCPALQTLSLNGNPGWPSTRDLHKYKEFRKTTMKMLPTLRNLDGHGLKRKLSSSSCSSISSCESFGSFSSFDSEGSNNSEKNLSLSIFHKEMVFQQDFVKVQHPVSQAKGYRIAWLLRYKTDSYIVNKRLHESDGVEQDVRRFSQAINDCRGGVSLADVIKRWEFISLGMDG